MARWYWRAPMLVPTRVGERGADAEADRHQHVFQPAADAVAGDRGVALAADQAGDEQHGAVGQDDDQAGDQADLEDVAEGGPAESAGWPAQPEQRAWPQQARRHPERREGEGDHRRQRRTADAERRQAEPAQGQRAGQRDLQRRGEHQRIARRLHVAGAAQHRGHGVGDPVREAAEEQDRGEGLGAVERAAAAAQRAVDGSPEAHEDDREQRRHAERDDQRVRRRRLGRGAIARAQGAGDRRGDAAAHGAGRHLAERHLGREDQGQGCEVDDAELAHEPAVGNADQALHGDVQHVGRRQRQDGGHDRPNEHHRAAFSRTHAGLGSMRPANDARAYLMS